MKIAVITPVYRTPLAWLQQCLASVRSQTVSCTHFLVNDGDDRLHAADFADVEFFQLPKPHADFGNVARAIGSASAIARDFDAVAYLDADNWYEPDHLERMVDLHKRTGAAVCTAGRNLRNLDGELLGLCPEVDGNAFADTSSMFLTKAGFGLVSVWYLMAHALAAAGDRVVWRAVKDGNYVRAYEPKPTLNFRTKYLAHYTHFGMTPPPGAKSVNLKMTREGELIAAETIVHDGKGDHDIGRPAIAAPVPPLPLYSGGEGGVRGVSVPTENVESLHGPCSPLTPTLSPRVQGERGQTSQPRCDHAIATPIPPLPLYSGGEGRVRGVSVPTLNVEPLHGPCAPLTPALSPRVQGERGQAAQPRCGHARVSLCMIAKNEAANLEGCLRPLAGLFSEVIVVDTGSTDGTKERALRLGAKVFDFTWIDSFAAARNESIKHAKGDWIFWLDGDERLDAVNLKKLRNLLAELPDDNNAYMMCQSSAPDKLTGSTIVVDQMRLFRNLPEVRWRGRVHEQIYLALLAQGAREIRTDIVIGHLGYQDPGLRLRKQERNIRLLHIELKDNPRDGFAYFNLANAYMDFGKVEEALGFLQRCLELSAPRLSYMPKAHALLAGGYHLLGRDEEALRCCRAGEKEFPEDAGLWFQEGILLMAKGDLAGARRAFETILKLPGQGHYTGTDGRLSGCRTRHNLGYIYRRLGLVKEAEAQWRQAVAQTPEFEPPWLALVELYLDQKRPMEAEALLLRVEGKPYQGAIQPALQARLTLARGDIDGARRILEKALTRNPKALWLRILLADILLRVAKDDKAAERHLRTILSLCPNEHQARQMLAQIVNRRGR